MSDRILVSSLDTCLTTNITSSMYKNSFLNFIFVIWFQQDNSLSSQLLEMYTRPMENRQIEVPPPIDISSDDSNEPFSNEKAAPVINSQV